MNRDKAREAAAILLAYAEGKTIQFRKIASDMPWNNLRTDLGPDDFVDWEYRIKPEPREFWVALSKDGKPIHVGDQFGISLRTAHEWVHVREVTDDG